MLEMRNLPSRRQPTALRTTRSLHLNMAVPSMTLGGAERIVYDIASTLDATPAGVNLFVMTQVSPSFRVEGLRNVRVIRPQGRDRVARLGQIASEVLASPNSTLYTHLFRMTDVDALTALGVQVRPVIHNSAQGWHEPIGIYERSRATAFVAVSDSVKTQLWEAGLTKPISVLRHELVADNPIVLDAAQRDEIRRRHSIRSDVHLIGMVGQFKSHKAYVRAVRVLARLRAERSAKLIILGGWDHDYGAGRTAYTATMQAASDFGVLPDLICAGPVSDVGGYYHAFDVFLNTSIYEGLSIATVEAVRAGCPVVCSDVGGQREAVGPADILVSDASDIDEYVRAIVARLDKPRPAPPSPRPASDLIPRLWLLLGEYGAMAPRLGPGTVETLFVTSNLNPGGPQRSLTNLLCRLRAHHRLALCVLDHVLGDGFIAELEDCGVPLVSVATAGGQLKRVEGVLDLLHRLGARTICFWNADPALKLLVTKILENASVRIVDVSPGPMLFTELEQAHDLQHRIAFDTEHYMRRLDALVSKYGGERSHPWVQLARRSVVIPNGVPLPSRVGVAPVRTLDPDLDPRFAIVTACRIAPTKQLERLVDMMKVMARLNPMASLTVVGGVDQRHWGYWQSIQDLIAAERLANIRFTGPRSDIYAILPQYRLFVMVSQSQGCPNASLEAMACGLPVVANDDGGTAEQVANGRTGYLVESHNSVEMARKIAALLSDPMRLQRFGAAGRARAERLFSMDKMATAYLGILGSQRAAGSRRPRKINSAAPESSSRARSKPTA